MTGPSERVFSRIFFDAPCEIRGAGQVWSSQVLDISLQGALLSEPEDFSGTQGETFDIAIQLGDGAASIEMEAVLRHYADQCLGFECSALDLDSATHLRRLVELNLGDEDELHRELGHLIDS